MQKKIVFTIFFLLICVLLLNAKKTSYFSSKKIVTKKKPEKKHTLIGGQSIEDTLKKINSDEFYKKKWTKVGNLVKKGLYKSAEKEIDQILVFAKQENNHQMIVKTQLKKINLWIKNDLSPLYRNKIITTLKKTITEISSPSKEILQSILAEYYWDYLSKNIWKISQQTENNEYNKNDIHEWPKSAFINIILKNIHASITPDTLKKIELQEFKSILHNYSSKNFEIDTLFDYQRTPYLYDFLVSRSIRLIQKMNFSLPKSSKQFVLNKEAYLGLPTEFIEVKIPSFDSLNKKFQILNLYQQITQFHLKNKNEIALLDVTLKRLNYARKNSILDSTTALYNKAVDKIIKKYQNNRLIAEYYFYQANRYNNKASYSKKNKKNQFDKKIALDICQKAIKKFPHSLGAKKCIGLIQKIKQKNFFLESVNYVVPSFHNRYIINVKNIEKIYTKLIKVDLKKYKEIINKDEVVYYNRIFNNKKLINYIKNNDATLNKTDVCKLQGDYLSHSYEFYLPKLKKGIYFLICSTDSSFHFNKSLIRFSTIISTNLNVSTNNENQEILVTNRSTGKPIKDAEIKMYSREYNSKKNKYEKKFIQKIKTNVEGIGTFTKDKEYQGSYYFEVQTDDDVLPNDVNFYNNRSHKKIDNTKTHFFLDRAIYRPGQKLYFKGIIIQTDKNGNQSIVSNKQTTVKFKDANYTQFKEIKVTTNEYGSYSGTVELPTGRLNGSFVIQDKFGSKRFQVEEYKRPTFETKFNAINKEFMLNDTVEIKGFAKAYAGNMIDGAKVKYEVLRKTFFPSWSYRCWVWLPPTEEVTIITGKTKSDENGEYNIRFKAIPDLSIKQKFNPTFNYIIKATVTDINGETHTTQTNIRIGKKSMFLNTQIKEFYEIESKDSILINAKNLNGKYINTKGKYKIYKLEIPKNVKRSSLLSDADFKSMPKHKFHQKFPFDYYKKTTKNHWKEIKLSQSGNFLSNKKIALKIKNLGLGIFKIIATANDKNKKEVKDIGFFSIMDSKSKKAITEKGLFIKRLNPTENEPGDTANFLVASHYPTYNFLLQIERTNKDNIDKRRILKKWYFNQKGQKVIKIPISKNDIKGIFFTIIMNKNNVIYNTKIKIPVSQKNKELKINFVSFRDKLVPGNKEKWTISLTSGYGKQVFPEVLASMYDKSLDAFVANNYYLNNKNTYYSKSNWRVVFNRQKYLGYKKEMNFNTTPVFPSFFYPRLNYFDAFIDIERNSSISYLRKLSLPVGDKNTSNLTDRYSEELQKKKQLESEENKYEENQIKNITARKKFNETAFFYPHLKTNQKGEIDIEFTIPETLTKWKFMALAHTKDFKVGQLLQEIVTQKELMVVPNAPRFLRGGDTITISAKITNLTKDSLPSIGKLILINPYNQKDLTSKFELKNQVKKIVLPPNKSNSISWEIIIPEGLGAISYKIVAKGGKHSDGEQNLLPILSNKKLVTESMPMSIRKKGQYNFTFKKLVQNNSKTLKHHNLTLEFTKNPAWYAIQAMPYMMEYPYECTEQIFTRYYSNAIASHIMNSNPKIKQIVDVWKNQSPEAFMSNLEKNQELKSILLEETPWVLKAKNESQRKKNIALLFDLEKMNNELNIALSKIKRNQINNGVWPWFSGMKENRYITQYIVTGFGHLKNLKVTHNDNHSVNKILKKAISYLDNELVKDYENMKEKDTNWKTNNHLSHFQIQYFYARSFFDDIPISKKTKSAYDYYFNSAKKNWLKYNIHTQAMIGLFISRKNEKSIAADIYKSLKERSVSDKEFGRYWEKYNSGKNYYWYQAPIETQALMIELFDEVAKDEEMVEDLKIWLLKQKQTTDWKTTKATANACYALLLRGSDILTTRNNLNIFLGNKKIVYNKKSSSHNEIGIETQAGTGYLKHQFSSDEIQKSYGKVTVEKNENTLSWGSLYWQYWEDLDKITHHKTPLHLEKTLFVVKNEGDGEKIIKISENEISVGDQIRVRIILRSDRNMEYVHLKDMRASGFEPINVISRYKYQGGLGYYESTKDASTNFFFSYIPKGTYVFEYDLRANHKGSFSNGIATIQCMYAPEFTSHSDGIRVKID